MNPGSYIRQQGLDLQRWIWNKSISQVQISIPWLFPFKQLCIHFFSWEFCAYYLTTFIDNLIHNEKSVYIITYITVFIDPHREIH